jgi:hypothetical protein
VTLDRDLLARIRGLDEHGLRRLLVFAGEVLRSRTGERAPVPTGRGPGRVTYRQELVRCGRPTCTRCPHGPYWYAYWREAGRRRSRYVGKELPEGASGPV